MGPRAAFLTNLAVTASSMLLYRNLRIAGCAVGAALIGYRPIVELMFGDFLTIASEQIVNCAAKMRWSLGGAVDVPIVYRTAYGGGVGAGMHHSQCFESWFAGVPGLKVVLPSTPG